MNTQTFFSTWYVRGLSVLILVGVVVALGAYTHATLKEAQYANTGPTTISVRGEGEVLARPDIGQFSFSVRAEGDDAATAQELSAEAINAIIDFLKNSDVDENDIKTQNYNLNPKYSYEERVCLNERGYCPPGERVIDGYEVNQSVQIKVRDLDAAGDLISGVGERGATNISSLQFTIDDESILKGEAREKAITDAQEKAEKLADDLGVKLVRMISYYENEDGYRPEPMFAMDMAESSVGSFKSAPALPTGENTITSRVDMMFEVK